MQPQTHHLKTPPTILLRAHEVKRHPLADT